MPKQNIGEAIAREREVIKEGWVAKKEQKDKTNN